MHTGLPLICFCSYITTLGLQSGQLQSEVHEGALITCLWASVHLTAEDTAGAVGVSTVFKT